MTVVECPLCCAEKFTDICSLESHLLDLCENIVCPICELQFRTIKTLAWHLGQECKISAKQLPDLVCAKEINPDCQTRSKNDVSGYENLLVREEIVGDDEIVSNEFMKNEDANCNEITDDNAIETESRSVNKEGIKDDTEFFSPLYSCSVCDINFSSIEEHLNEFHKNENVIVDKNIHMERVICDGKKAFPNNSFLWPHEEEDNLMNVNWNSKVESIIKTAHNVIKNSNVGPEFSCNNQNEMLDSKVYYVNKSGEPQDIMDKRNVSIKDNKLINDSVNENGDSGSRLVEEWPESLRKYPVATFIKCNEIITNGNVSYLCENKPYLFNEHRVRLIKFNQGREPLKIEDIPFFEEPPDSIVPIMQIVQDVPDDLSGSYTVLWPCHLCGKLVYHWSDLAKHCCNSSSKYYPCTICRKSFQSRRSLNNHYSVIHEINLSSGCYSCPLCSAKVQTSSHLEKHLAMHKKNDLIKCDLCQSMIQRSTYNDHLKAHGTNGSLHLVCQLCNRPFKGKRELDLHIPQCHMRHNEADHLKCQKCMLSYEDLQTLREHLVSHGISIKSHLCAFCPKSYNRLIDKVIHERVHTKSKPHSCNECGRCFRLRNSLVAHRRIHTGERPFKCSFCSRSFRTKHLQRSHISTHSAVYRFKCKYCNKHFQSKVKVEAHENSHKKPFVCFDCKRTFYSLRFAKKHMENHKNGQLNYTCNLCPNMFTRAAYLETHLRTKHNLDTQTSISISTQKTYQQMEGSFNKHLF